MDQMMNFDQDNFEYCDPNELKLKFKSKSKSNSFNGC